MEDASGYNALVQINHGQNRTSELSALQPPSSYRSLFDTLREAQALVAAKDNIENQFLDLFSAKSLACRPYDESPEFDPVSVEQSVYSGRFRRFDQLISESLVATLLNPARSDATSCLEIGAGTSYGQGRHHGAPWLSRSFAKAFPELATFKVSDITSSCELHWFFVDANGALSSRPLRSIQFEPGIPLSTISSNDKQTVFAPIDTTELIYFLGPRAALFLNEISRVVGSEAFYDGKLFLRPALDSEFEKKVFNLDVKTSVNFMDLSGLGSFDYIFARHQAPFPIAFEAEKLSNLSRAIRGALTPTGIALVEFGESDIFSPAPLVVTGSKLSPDYVRPKLGIETIVSLIQKARGF